MRVRLRRGVTLEGNAEALEVEARRPEGEVRRGEARAGAARPHQVGIRA